MAISQFGHRVDNLSQIIAQIFTVQGSFYRNDSPLIFLKFIFCIMGLFVPELHSLSFGQYITIVSIFFQVIESTLKNGLGNQINKKLLVEK